MKLQLTLAAAMAALCIAGPAWAQAIVVVGGGPERLCYLGAKTGIDQPKALESCDVALGNGLVMHDRAATFVNRGVIEHKMGRTVTAMEDFNNCLQLIPDQPDAFLNLGVAKITLGQYSDALADIQKGLSLGPSEPALGYYDRAIAYEKLGRIGDAYSDYQRALQEAPGFTAASNALSRFRLVPKPKV